SAAFRVAVSDQKKRISHDNFKQRGETDETSSDCNHSDRRGSSHAVVRSVWPGQSPEQRLCAVRLWQARCQYLAQRLVWRQAGSERHVVLENRLLDSGDGDHRMRSGPGAEAGTAAADDPACAAAAPAAG